MSVPRCCTVTSHLHGRAPFRFRKRHGKVTHTVRALCESEENPTQSEVSRLKMLLARTVLHPIRRRWAPSCDYGQTEAQILRSASVLQSCTLVLVQFVRPGSEPHVQTPPLVFKLDFAVPLSVSLQTTQAVVSARTNPRPCFIGLRTWHKPPGKSDGSICTQQK